MKGRFTGTVQYRREDVSLQVEEGVSIEIVTERNQMHRRVMIPGLGEGLFTLCNDGSFRNGHWALAPDCQICLLRGSLKGGHEHWRGEFCILRNGITIVNGSFVVNKPKPT